jgi:hypothetical protein
MAITWLSMIEGQQASLVGLPPVDPELYKDSHTITYKNGALAFRGDNFDRYLMGRQFMVLLVVFLIESCGNDVPHGSSLGSWLTNQRHGLKRKNFGKASEWSIYFGYKKDAMHY